MLMSAIAAIESESDRHFMEDLYRRYYPLMYKKALSMLQNAHEAEDAVEAAMLKLIDRIDLLRACRHASLRSYLLSCAKNAAIDQLRRDPAARRYSFSDVQERIEAVPDGEEADAGLLRAEQIEAVAAALNQLPDRERELLRMKYYEELPDQEIAEIFGLAPSTVRSNLTRARRKLGAILKEAERNAE